MKNFRRLTLLVLSMLPLSLVQAEQMQQFDGPDGSQYEVHYMAFISTFLQPEIAQQYQLVRSRAVGVVNVSVLKKSADGSAKAVGSVLEGRMINDIQQQQMMAFQQIVEGTAIYYLSQMQITEGEVLTFDLSLYPEGSVQPLKLRFSQTFYHD